MVFFPERVQNGSGFVFGSHGEGLGNETAAQLLIEPFGRARNAAVGILNMIFP
jgi:hypothetical protein